MAHVSANYAYAKACLRKRPFDSQEDAEKKRSQDFAVYQCQFCGKWHRTSRPHLKRALSLRRQRDKTLRRIEGLKRREYFKSLKRWDETEQTQERNII